MRSILWLVFALLAASLSVATAEAERIIRYESDITIESDTSLTVTETITVHALRKRIKHGIFRDFPQLYQAGSGFRRKRGFEVLEVTKDGSAENYVVERLSGGKRVRIGRGNHYLRPGPHTYRIKYRTTRQLGYFDTYDELYWNVTGNGWDFTMDEVTAKVTVPPGATVSSAEAYTGAVGGKGGDSRSEIDGQVARFETTRPLAPREGLTVVVTFPKGLITYSADRGGLGAFLRDNLGLAAALLGLVASVLFFVFRWAKVGRDPAAGTIIPRFEPPDGFSPAAVRTLDRMAFDQKAFSAAVIGLAAKGEIEIKEQDKKTYQLVNRFVEERAEDDPLTSDEEALKEKLIGKSRQVTLLQKNHARISSGMSALKSSLDSSLKKSHYQNNTGSWFIGLLIFLLPVGIGFLVNDPTSFGFLLVSAVVSLVAIACVKGAMLAWRMGSSRIIRTLIAAVAIAGLVIAVGAHAKQVGWLLAAVAPSGLVLATIFHHLMKAPTPLGRQRLDEIAGFKHYLSVAEEERLNFENPPHRTPELFERFLPYALALDVEQEWSEQFADVLAQAATSGESTRTYSPSFYTGDNFAGLGAAAMAAAIGSTLASNLASSSVSPSSGGGGSGGGGFSGGGGGGGGGGGW